MDLTTSELLVLQQNRLTVWILLMLLFCLQSYWEITSDDYLAYISNYVVGLGPWKDTIVPVTNNYLMAPSDLVARAHAHNLQV
jgi:hypothetical protein